MTVAILSVALAAPAKPKPFSVGEFFEGSWVISEQVMDLATGDLLKEGELMQYNVTKTNDNEYDIFPLEKNSYERKQDAEQIVMLTSSPLNCELQKFDTEKDEFISIGEIQFVAMMPHDSFMSSGMNPMNEHEEYEITTLGPNHFTIKFISRSESKAVVYAATRVIIPPPLTFMEKYGMSLLMAALILVQVCLGRFDYV